MREALVRPATPRGLPTAPGYMSPSLDLDFINGSFPSAVTFTRAGSGTYFDAAGGLQTAAVDVPRIDHDPVTLARRGLLIEGARTNLFLNSAAPASQSVAVTAQSYALSFRGAGSITVSGAHTAVVSGTGANIKTSLVFTPAAGTLTMTLSGSVTEPQLEAGSCATSYALSTASAGVRASDACSFAVVPWWNAAEGTFLVEWQDINAEPGNVRILATNGSGTILNVSSRAAPNNATGLQTFNTSVALLRAHGSDVTKGIRRGAVGYSASGRSVVFGGVVSSDANPLMVGGLTNLFIGHSSTNTLYMQGYMRRVSYWPRRLSDADLAALTA